MVVRDREATSRSWSRLRLDGDGSLSSWAPFGFLVWSLSRWKPGIDSVWLVGEDPKAETAGRSREVLCGLLGLLKQPSRDEMGCPAGKRAHLQFFSVSCFPIFSFFFLFHTDKSLYGIIFSY